MPTCTWGMSSENMECRVDTHGALKKKLSRFGGWNPEKFNFEYLVCYRKDGKKGIFLVFRKFFFIKRHVHMPTCTWGMWSENMECRVDTHGAMKKNLSQFGGQKPYFEVKWIPPLVRDNQAIICAERAERVV